MKHLRIIIAVLLALAITAACFTACKKDEPEADTVVTVAVTDENGEPVTDEKGEAVTEVVSEDAGEVSVSVEPEITVSVDDGSASNAAPAGNNGAAQTTAAANSKDKSKKDNGKSAETTTAAKDKTPVEKPKAPAKPTGFKAEKVTESSIELTWNKQDCTGFIIYKCDEHGTPFDVQQTKKNSYTFKKLDSSTTYYFALIAYNENAAGKTNSEMVQTKGIQTKEDTSNRQRKIVVKLPTDMSDMADTLHIYISKKDSDKVSENPSKSVECDGKTYTYTTDKKYAGTITVTAKLDKHDVSAVVYSDKDTIEVDLTAIGIDIMEGGDF